jgi:hypothetical protein
MHRRILGGIQTHLHYHRSMALNESNPYLRSRSEASRKAELRISAKTSSAVEGIRAPFAEDRLAEAPASWEGFTAYWQQRAALTARRRFRVPTII